MTEAVLQPSARPAQRMPRISGSLGYDIPASVVVFLVAVPLCLGIALASGAPLLSGIVAGVVGGIVVASLSGSEVSVSGPAAGLAVVVAEAITQLGSFPAFLATVVMAGFLQLVFAGLRLGKVGEFVPNCVIKGMLAGIGIVIILKQFPHALGRDTNFSGDQNFFQYFNGENTFTDIILATTGIHPTAFLIAVVSLAIMFAWELPFIKKSRFKLFMPAPLAVVILGSIMAYVIGHSDSGLALEQAQHYVSLPKFSSVGGLVAQLPSPDFTALADPKFWKVAFTIAVVASLESLLSLEASDKLDPFRRISSTNRELFAQGIGNMVSGLAGGIPVTAVVVRTSANVYAGGRTRLSGILHGVFILSAVLLVPNLLNSIPLACLAAILIAVGYKLASPTLFRTMMKDGASQFLPFLITIIGIVFTDLLTGVLLGLGVGLYFVVKTNRHAPLTMVHDEGDYLLRFNKDMSFVNKSELKEALIKIPDNSSVLLDGTNAMFIDHDVTEIVQDFIEQACHRGIAVAEKNTGLKSLPLSFPKWRKYERS